MFHYPLCQKVIYKYYFPQIIINNNWEAGG